MRWNVLESSVGELVLATDGDVLRRLSFVGRRLPPGSPTRDDPLLRAAAAELAAYFDGELTEFTIPVTLRGSDFECRVWAALREIPYGETRSYGAIAKAVGEPEAARAVGVANNRNPVAIIVPCHRVVGADGKLVGYGGGLDRKTRLLELEARVRIEHDFAALLGDAGD